MYVSEAAIERIIEEEYQRILRELHGTFLYGIPVDTSNVKQLVVAMDMRKYAREHHYPYLTERERKGLYEGTWDGGDSGS